MVDASKPAVSAFTEEDSDFQLSALVQSFPCIWDTDNLQYRCSKSREAAWEQIAQDMEGGRIGSVEEYKLKWRLLRDKYAKYLRDCDNPHHESPYFYLAKAMEFLKPYIKRRLKTWLTEDNDNQEGKKANAKRPATIFLSDSDDETDPDEREEKSSGTGRFISVDARNEDAMFLLGVLPNMRQMSAERKKLFKVCLLQACDHILG